MSNMMIPQDIRKLSRQRAPEFHRVLRTPQPAEIEVGQIWSTRSHLDLPDGRCFEAEEPRLVVVLDGAGSPSESLDQISAAPVSLSTQMAAQFDLIVSGDASPIGFDFLVEVWNETPVLKGCLRRFLGGLSAEVIAALRGLYVAQLLDENVPDALTEWVGLHIMGENDPRLAFQEAEVEAVAYLARAAAAALTLETIVPEPVRMPAPLLLRCKRFELPLMFGKLPDYLRGTAIAYAAGPTGSEEAYIITQSGDEEYFTFELLASRRPPYAVYLIVHEISPALNGSTCVVTISTAEEELRSIPTELRVGAQIQVGEDPNFSPSSVNSTVVEIA